MRRTKEGKIQVGTSAAEAIGLFTPEGEREWVPGWDPSYATEDVSEASGTAFTTHVGDVDTYWVIIEIDRDASRSAYARITPGCHVGTVIVECVDNGNSTCEVSVSYDMTLLDGADPAHMDGYDTDGFDLMLQEWSEMIANFLESDAYSSGGLSRFPSEPRSPNSS